MKFQPHSRFCPAPIRVKSVLLAAALTCAGATVSFSPAPQQLLQEVARVVALPAGVTNGFNLLDRLPDGQLRVASANRWYAIAGDRLEAVPSPPGVGPQQGWVTVGDRPVQLPVPLTSVRQVLRTGQDTWLATAEGLLRLSDGAAPAWELANQDVRQLAVCPDGTLVVATGQGLWQRRDSTPWERLRVVDDLGRDWTAGEVRGVGSGAGGDLWVATPAGVLRRQGPQWRLITGREGLPWADFTGVAPGPEGEVWFGTHRGAVWFDGTDWAYREGPRWLPGNDVRSVVVDTTGRVWLATDRGLGCWERRPMTLAQKAAHYEAEIERYIKRTPFGYVSEVGLAVPGDRSQILYRDSDNDGLWTAMYGAGECFAYGATKQPEYKRRAQQAFEALRFLQQVTQGGRPSPPRGFVARTIRPADWPDPNIGQVEADRAEQQRDRRWKVLQPRWPRSADGRWFWKADTSSDELDGHFFFYAAYHDLVAEDEAERQRIRAVVGDLADHLLTHDFALVDHDGRPTRWAVFGPQALNHDPDWYLERGLNSLSILSYLAVATRVTGDPKYWRAAQALIDRHGYGANVMNPKVQMGVGSGNQSDDEMAFMCFYNLLRYAPETPWQQKWRFAFHLYWRLEQPEMNPLFNFLYAAVGRGQTFADAFGPVPVDPWEGWLEDAMATLRGLPLDRADWPHHNSHRLDLMPLRRQQMVDFTEDQRPRRAARVTGKVLPVAERHFAHWNTDPWRLDYPGQGRELASGTVFLLPYYLGLYHGFIEKPH